VGEVYAKEGEPGEEEGEEVEASRAELKSKPAIRLA
jgi:hypothetical protein